MSELVSECVREWDVDVLTCGAALNYFRDCRRIGSCLRQPIYIYIPYIYIYVVCLYTYFPSANKTSIAWYKLQITLNRLRLEATHGGARRCTRPQVLDALMLRCLFVPCGSIREHLSSCFRPQATHNVALPRSVDTSVVNYLSLKSLTHAAAVATTTTATPSTIMYLH